MRRPTIALLIIAAPLIALAGCDRPPAPPEKPSISYRTKVENLDARVEKSWRLSETESVKILIVPGWPTGERCVVWTNGATSSMQCREVSPSRQ